MKLADARGRFEWEQTSAQMALLVNMFRDQKKSKPVKAADFNPYYRQSKEQVMMHVPVSVLKDVFVKQKPGSS